MKILTSGIFAAVLAVLLAVGITADRASAHGSDASGGNLTNYHEGGHQCNNSHRISLSDATCLSGKDQGYVLSKNGHIHWVNSECASYGEVVAHIDIQAARDTHWHLEGWHGQYLDNTGGFNVRKISCCIDEGDNLCWKNQVEPIESGDWAGHIQVITVHSSSYSTAHVDVSTHEKRYRLCSSDDTVYSNSLYCQNDPSGDAFVAPPPTAEELNQLSKETLRARPCGGDDEPDCTCGDHICDRFDCLENYEQSTASEMCFFQTGGKKFFHRESAMLNCEAQNIRCRVAQYYIGQGNYHQYYADRAYSFDASMSELRTLNNCDGVPTIHSCPVVAGDCMNYYRQSSADDSCRSESASVENVEDRGTWCALEAECRKPNGTWWETYIEILPTFADELLNCRGEFELEC